MKIKRFEAPSIQVALEKVKEDFGENALILSTRKIRKPSGPKDLFGEITFEITAGLEPEKAGFQKKKVSLKNSLVDEYEELRSLREEILSLREEVRAIVRNETSGLPLSMSEIESNLYRLLRSNGISNKPALRVIKKFHLAMGKNMTKIADLETLVSLLSEDIPVSGGTEIGEIRPKAIALVGPTGVGKTTTIAKLAANFNLTSNKKIALFTLDTYRIAAVEQLRAYSQIIGIPLEVIENYADLKTAYKRHQDKDLILIDTSGRNQKRKDQLATIRDILQVLKNVEIHLVLSATTNTEIQQNTVENFKMMPIDHLIFTKLDEAMVFGSIYNITSQCQIPVSYLTNGQDVPQDIETADARKIAKYILCPGQSPSGQ